MSDTLWGVVVGGLITGIVTIFGQIIANRHIRKLEEQKLKHEKQLGKVPFMEKRLEDAIKVAIHYARSSWALRQNPTDPALITAHIQCWLESWRAYGELGMFLERKDAEMYLEIIREMAELRLDLLINDGSPGKRAAFQKVIEPIRDKADRLLKSFRDCFATN